VPCTNRDIPIATFQSRHSNRDIPIATLQSRRSNRDAPIATLQSRGRTVYSLGPGQAAIEVTCDLGRGAHTLGMRSGRANRSPHPSLCARGFIPRLSRDSSACFPRSPPAFERESSCSGRFTSADEPVAFFDVPPFRLAVHPARSRHDESSAVTANDRSSPLP
jgi:hypothetical protein